MPKIDPRVDAYIAKSADFARPILIRLRKLIHAGCRDVEETIKWGMPAFVYKRNLCGFAGFKRHCAFFFWPPKPSAVLSVAAEEKALGQFGRITSVGELPADAVIKRYVKKAAALRAAGVKRPPRGPTKPLPKTPADFLAALRTSKKARANFAAFSLSHQREYLEWIIGAKRPETRAKRIATALLWIGQGKSQNWRYERRRDGDD